MPQSAGFRRALDRAETIRVLDDNASDENKPDYTSPLYDAQMEDVGLVRNVYGGTKTMRAAKEIYLPKNPEEEREDYETRLDRCVLFNATARTVKGLVGMVFRKDPVLMEDVPASIAADAENIDMAGRALPVFARDVFENAMIDGHTWVHIEMPKVDGERVRTRADERQAGVRPYWVNVLKQDAINWRYTMIGGKPVLTLFVYRETALAETGEYGAAVVERFRVLRPGSFEVWEKQSEGEREHWVMVDGGPTSLSYIPVVYVPANRTGIYESTPPLLDLAYLNIAHWQIYSDHRYGLWFAMVPMPVFTGVEDVAFRWGPNATISLPNPESGAQILEASGSALEHSKTELKDTEARMAALGLQMLVRETRAAETAQAKMLDKAESDSALAAAARALEDALEEALAIHGEYRGERLSGAIQVNRDFHEQSLDPQMVTAYSNMVAAGQLSLDTMWAELVRGEVLHEDFDPEVERERIEVMSPMEDMLRLAARTASVEDASTGEAA